MEPKGIRLTIAIHGFPRVPWRQLDVVRRYFAQNKNGHCHKLLLDPSAKLGKLHELDSDSNGVKVIRIIAAVLVFRFFVK